MTNLQTWDEFEENFKPIFNHFAAKNNPSLDAESCCAVNGRMFETYGEELEFVQSQDPNTVWTVIESDETEFNQFLNNFKCDCVGDEDDICTCGKAHEAAEEAGLEEFWVISKGFHLVNRLGFIVTQVPWNDETKDAQY